MFHFKLHYCAFLTLGAIVAHCSAASYQFVNIVDDSGPLEPGTAAINNSGTVAFSASLDAGGTGIFIGSGGAITTLYDSSGPFDGLGLSDINDSGTVAFRAGLDAGGGGLFTGNGGPTTTITSYAEGNIKINNQGAVVFKSFSGALYVGSGGPLTTIADNTTGPLSGDLQARSINDSGTVGFSAWHDGGGRGIFTGDGGPITTVALSAPGNPFVGLGKVQINNIGTVAFSALVSESPNYLEAIFIGSPGSTTMVADNYGPYLDFGQEIGLNNNGQVAFTAHLDAGGTGIFAGPDPLADKVIQIGDPLLGSTVTSLGFDDALNDNGEIAFHYNLANGIRGIAVARPVQPLAGDYNLNGTVDAADYVVWRKNNSQSYEAWRTLFGQSGLSTPVDFNNDGKVDAADYVVWRKARQSGYNTWSTNFGEPGGSGGGSAGAVPEPATLWLALAGVALWTRLRVGHRTKT